MIDDADRHHSTDVENEVDHCLKHQVEDLIDDKGGIPMNQYCVRRNELT
jgi:hypothetical protein